MTENIKNRLAMFNIFQGMVEYDNFMAKNQEGFM